MDAHGHTTSGLEEKVLTWRKDLISGPGFEKMRVTS